MMESSCFFGRAGGSSNPYSVNAPGIDSNKSHTSPDGDPKRGGSPGFDTLLHEKLNKIYFSNRHFGKSIKTVKEIVERANAEFDSLVAQLLKKVYSDNCEYHMMYPFVAR